MLTTRMQSEIRNSVIAKIDDLLETANGRRRKRIIHIDTVLEMIRDFGMSDKYKAKHGTTVTDSYGYMAFSTIILLARVNNRVYLGIAVTKARYATPGRAWKQLQPWKRGHGPQGDASAKWNAWTTLPNIVELDAMEIDAIKEGEIP